MGAANLGVTSAVPGSASPRFGTADASEACSSSESIKALARTRIVFGYGLLRAPRSSALIAFALTPALAANSSCVSPAASLKRRSRTPNVASLLLPPFTGFEGYHESTLRLERAAAATLRVWQ